MKFKILKSIPFLNAFVPEKVDKQTGVYAFGFDNMLPNKLMRWVLDSGVAKKAQQKRSIYISADGFNDVAAAELQVNERQTADDLLTETAGYLSYFDGFAWHIKRDGSYKIISVSALPFQDVRKKEDGNFIYNHTFSTDKFDKSLAQEIPAFKGNRALTPDEFMEVKDKGEILYAYYRTADNPHYPIPDYYAGIEDIRTSSELQKFDYETVLNGFITSGLLTIVGDIDTTTKDEFNRTEKDYLDEQLIQFTGMAKSANGVAGRNKLLVMNAATKDEAPILQTYDSKPIFEASNSKRDLIDRAVCRLFGVNPVLVGFADAAILGNQQALANASNELNNDVLADQALVTNALSVLYPDLDWTISSFKPVQYVPDALLNELTPAEKRQLIGYAPLEDSSDSGEKLLSERLGVSGTQSLVSILSDINLSAEQKRAALKLLFGLTEAQALELVPQDVIEETVNPEVLTNYFLNYHEIKNAITRSDINQRYEDYFNTVNMTYRELEKWSDGECSKASGLSRLPIVRNLELLNINKGDWTEKHYRWAGQTIAYINRSKDNVGVGSIINDGAGKSCGTKTFISLKNWGYNPDKV